MLSNRIVVYFCL